MNTISYHNIYVHTLLGVTMVSRFSLDPNPVANLQYPFPVLPSSVIRKLNIAHLKRSESENTVLTQVN